MFRISKEAHKWFKHILSEHPFAAQGDNAPLMNIYYLCALIGINSKENPMELEDGEAPFMKSWPSSYVHVRFPIIATLLNIEIERFNIEKEEKEAVKEHIKKYIDPKDPTQLTELGATILNNYSYTGYIILSKKLRGEAPKQSTPFLNQIYKLLQN